MGSADHDQGADRDEKPQHRVRLTRPFYLGVYEITQAQYDAVTGTNPSHFSSKGRGNIKVFGQSTDRHPAEQVLWLDAVAFCNKLSLREGRQPFYEINAEKVSVADWNGAGYRLPTEAEWEYACRGGARTTTRYSFGDDAATLGECGWFRDNSENRTHGVGEKRRNGFGLFDMHGNVKEWCWDRAGRDYYERSPAADPLGADRAAIRAIRGGDWWSEPGDCRSAYRDGVAPRNRDVFVGFRLARGHSSS
jgi:eukaryotic-like serine/threonine-protein kinase